MTEEKITMKALVVTDQASTSPGSGARLTWVKSGLGESGRETLLATTSVDDPLLTLQTENCGIAKRLTKLLGRYCCVSHSRYAIYGMAVSVAAPLWHARCALFEPLCF